MAKELYVGHLSEEVTEEELRKLFSVMGTVTSVHLIIDPETREFKRCAYVRMAADVDPRDVVETLDGAYLVDRVITVSIARPQSELKPGRPGGAGRPGPGARPKTGAGARFGARPKPGAGAKPGAGTRTGERARPIAGTRPDAEARSGAGTRSGAGARTGAGTRSEAGTRS